MSNGGSENNTKYGTGFLETELVLAFQAGEMAYFWQIAVELGQEELEQFRLKLSDLVFTLRYGLKRPELKPAKSASLDSGKAASVLIEFPRQEKAQLPEPPAQCSSCGQLYHPDDFGQWRWDGQTWQHQCGHAQAGHFPAS